MDEVSADFINRHTVDLTLRGGGRVRIRPIVAEDKDHPLAGLDQLTPLSRYRRFFSRISTLSTTMLAELTELDYDDRFAWVALDLDEPEPREPEPREPEPGGVGVARYIRLNADCSAAEVAIAVVNDRHRRGIGTLLLEIIALTAREHGTKRLVASVLVDNEPMTKLSRNQGAAFYADPAAGALRVEAPAPTAPGDIKDSVLYQRLRLAARGELGAAGDTGRVSTPHHETGEHG